MLGHRNRSLQPSDRGLIDATFNEEETRDRCVTNGLIQPPPETQSDLPHRE